MKKMIFYVLAMGLLAVNVHSLMAKEEYTLTVTQQQYEDLTGSDVTVFSTPDEIANFYLAYIPGFTFQAFGLNLGFDAASTGGQGMLFSIEGYIAADKIPENDKIVSFHGHLCNFFGRKDNTSSLSMKVEGTPGKGILKAQWKNMGFVKNPATDYTNFQVWLHEEGNIISYHYGPNEVTSLASFPGSIGPAVGFSVGDWPDFDAQNLSPAIYLSGNATKPSIQHPTGLSIAVTGVPANGTVYTFSPTTTSVPEPERGANNFRYFPNPFSSTITFAVPQSASMCRVVLCDALGNEVVSASGRDRIVIQRGNLVAGMYFYRILDGEKIISSGVITAE